MRRLISAVLVCAWALCQSNDAVLSGTVVDPTGSVIAGATVKALNTRTGVTLTTTSNTAGVYQFTALMPGVYRITGERQGFRTLGVNAVSLTLGDRVTVNLPLELGAVVETVEVSSESGSAVNYSTASVGGLINDQRVQELPLPGRNALGLVNTQAGVVGGNFAGSQIVALNITLDGINVQDNRINSGVASTLFSSVDRVEEVRVITAPADVEYGRGSGQVLISSRAGSNEFHGSLFEYHRNTIMRANTFFNNQRGDSRPILIRNQYGARIGGPVIKNKTFFHFLWEEERIRSSSSTTRTVYTAPARTGLFRFFPGAQNANANAAQPTVNLDGSPLRPPSATGDLQTVSLFNRDPNRMAADTTGVVKKMLDLLPLPNNFRVGDGLNTAGFTFSLPDAPDSRQYDFRIDHYFTPDHRFFTSYNWESNEDPYGFLAPPYPGQPSGSQVEKTRVLSTALLSTLSPNLQNEIRAGYQRPRLRFFAPWEVAGSGFLPTLGTQPYLPVSAVLPQLSNPFRNDNDPQGRISPVYQYGNFVSWLKNRHGLKGGVEVRLVSTNGFNSFDVMPRVTLGTGGVAVQNVGSIPSIGQNQGAAQNILNDLTGTVASIAQAFNAPGGLSPNFLAGEPKQRTWKTREYSWFFKDDFKVNKDLTLNLGVRYEYYGVPFDATGKAATLVGGSAGIFGISGTDYGALFKPGLSNGQLTLVNTVGQGSPNPELGMFNPDRNNFAPGVGVAWHLPPIKWLGERRLVLRAGYGGAYERTTSLRLVDVVSGDLPGLRERRLYTQAALLTLGSARLPLIPLGKPLDVLPVTDRTTTMRVYDTGLQSPWIQNWNFTLAHEVARRTSVEVRYVGSRGTRLIRGADMNEQNLFETGLLDAFRVTQAGGNSPLLDRLFNGFNVTGRGNVDGVNVRGSELARTNTTIQAFLTANNPGGFANYLNTTNEFTNVRGGIPRRAGFPENWITVNPQFASARLFGNFSDSSYHSMQIEVIKRSGAGWTLQSNYTWSKVLGDEEGDAQEQNDSFRTQRNRSLDRRLLDFNITHAMRNSGVWELPIGPGKPLLRNSSGVLGRILERWQIGFIYNLFSGRPIGLTGSANTFHNLGGATPDALVPIPSTLGHAVRTGNGVQYFQGVRVVPDPMVQTISADIRGRSTLRAIADSSGNLIAVNAQPGTLGNLRELFLDGPGSFRLDLNIIKRIRVNERFSVELRMDALNATNSPQWNNPNVDINSLNFGTITGTVDPRIVVVGARVNF